jgi:hypothetical protein
MPDKLSAQLEIFRRHPELGMVAGAANYWRSWEGGADEVLVAGHVQNVPLHPPEVSLEVYPLGKAIAPCNDVLVRREIVSQVGGFEDCFTGMYEDQAFLAKVYLAAPVYFSSQVTLKYRQHSDSCLAVTQRCGRYHVVRRQYLEWFADYVHSLPAPPPVSVELAIRRELIICRRRWLYSLYDLPKKIVRRVGRALGSLR